MRRKLENSDKSEHIIRLHLPLSIQRLRIVVIIKPDDKETRSLLTFQEQFYSFQLLTIYGHHFTHRQLIYPEK